jgi:hypothetical protein
MPSGSTGSSDPFPPPRRNVCSPRSPSCSARPAWPPRRPSCLACREHCTAGLPADQRRGTSRSAGRHRWPAVAAAAWAWSCSSSRRSRHIGGPATPSRRPRRPSSSWRCAVRTVSGRSESAIWFNLAFWQDRPSVTLVTATGPTPSRSVRQRLVTRHALFGRFLAPTAGDAGRGTLTVPAGGGPSQARSVGRLEVAARSRREFRVACRVTWRGCGSPSPGRFKMS